MYSKPPLSILNTLLLCTQMCLIFVLTVWNLVLILILPFWKSGPAPCSGFVQRKQGLDKRCFYYNKTYCNNFRKMDRTLWLILEANLGPLGALSLPALYLVVINNCLWKGPRGPTNDLTQIKNVKVNSSVEQTRNRPKINSILSHTLLTP